MCPQRSGSQAVKPGQLQKSHVNTCVARPTGDKMVEFARKEAEVQKPTTRGHSMSHQVKDVKVNEVEPAVNKMTVED